MKKFKKNIVAAIAVISMFLANAVVGNAATIKPSVDSIELKNTETEISFDITLKTEKSFAGAEFALKPSKSDVKFSSLTFSDTVKNENTVKRDINGTLHFGFFDGNNKFTAGEYKVATVTYTYTGDKARSISLISSKIVVLEENGKTKADTSSKTFTVDISRTKSNDEIEELKKALEKAKAEAAEAKKRAEAAEAAAKSAQSSIGSAPDKAALEALAAAKKAAEKAKEEYLKAKEEQDKLGERLKSLEGKYTKPGKVKNLKAKSTKKAIALSWKKVKDADGYNIYRATNKKGSYKLLKILRSGSKIKFSDKKIKKDKNYFYRVNAYRESEDVIIKGDLSKKVKAKIKQGLLK